MQVRVRRGHAARKNMPQRQTMRLAARRRKRRIVFSVLGALLAVLLVSAVIYLTHMPALMIQTVEVSGARDVSESAIKKYVVSVLDDGRIHLISPRMVFAYPQMTITAGLRSQFPRLNTVSVSRPSLFSNTLLIHVTERVPYALWCSGQGAARCYNVDSSGYVYTETDMATTSGYVLLLGGVMKSEDPIGLYVTPEHFSGTKDLLAGLTSSGFETRSLSVLNATDFEIMFMDGLRVRGSFELSPSEMMSNLMLAMSADSLRTKKVDIDYIDLRFGNRVYYKFK